MDIITRPAELQEHLTANDICLVFVKTASCGVCDAVLEKVNLLLTEYPQVKGVLVSMEETPEVAAEFLVFTAPTILLFVAGKEVFRQARFVVLGELEDTLQTWIERLEK